MRTDVYQVDANWDPEAGVWYATSENMPGLATEADGSDWHRELRRWPARYTPQLKKVLLAKGCHFVRQGKGDREIWYSPLTQRHFVVDFAITKGNKMHPTFSCWERRLPAGSWAKVHE